MEDKNTYHSIQQQKTKYQHKNLKINGQNLYTNTKGH